MNLQHSGKAGRGLEQFIYEQGQVSFCRHFPQGEIQQEPTAVALFQTYCGCIVARAGQSNPSPGIHRVDE